MPNPSVSTNFRSPNVFKPQSAVSVASETTVWTPTSGFKFRLMAVDLYGSVAGAYTFKDNTSGTTIAVVYLDGTTPRNVVFGQTGILSATKGNVLTCTGPAASAITGTIYGTEEPDSVTA